MTSHFFKRRARDQAEPEEEPSPPRPRKKLTLKFDASFDDSDYSQKSDGNSQRGDNRNGQASPPLDAKPTVTHTVHLRNPMLSHYSVRMPFHPYDYQQESIERILQALQEGKQSILFESATGTGKTQTILTSLLSHIEHQTNKGASGKSPKILFFTRTVTQMNQIIREVKRSSYGVRSTILASRNYLCLNEEVLKSDSSHSKKLLCAQKVKDRSCKYKNNYFPEKQGSKDSKEFLGGEINDIEDLRTIGVSCQICPYYYAKNIVTQCDVVVLSYNYLIDRECRSTIFNMIRDNYIVFDEAHNLVRLLEESSSWELNCADFVRFRDEMADLKKLLEKAGLGAADMDFWTSFGKFENVIGDIQDGFTKLREELGGSMRFGEESNMEDGDRYKAGSEIARLFRFEQFKQNDYLNGLVRLMETYSSSFGLLRFIKIYSDLLGIWLRDPKALDGFELHCSAKGLISFLCMESAVKFGEIVNFGPRLIMLVSGTLSPFEALEAQLNKQFEEKISIAPDPEKWRLKLSATALTTFFEYNNFREVNLNYRTRTNTDVLDKFFAFFLQLLPAVPEGVLVFLPSYKVLSEYRDFLYAHHSTESRLNALKIVFFESQSKKSDEAFARYRKACKGRGAVFFLVFGGKFSEGLDFKDELARLVIIMGIPFGNLIDVRVRAKQSYLRRSTKDAEKYQAKFQRWYRTEAFSLINQASGRVKRNETDYGYIMLIDSRFNDPVYRDMLSSQIKQLMVNFDRFPALKEHVRVFFERNKQLAEQTRPSSAPEDIAEQHSADEPEKRPPGLMNFDDMTFPTDSLSGHQQSSMKRVKPDRIERVEVSPTAADDCIICYQRVPLTDLLVSKCGHVACRDCWEKSLKFSLQCMLCKTRTRMENLTAYFGGAEGVGVEATN